MAKQSLRATVVATMQEYLAAGQTPSEAVASALRTHGITLPTPTLANALAQAVNRQVSIAATDGFLHDGRTKEEEAATAAETRRLFHLFNALEGLATLQDIERYPADIPPYSAYRVRDYLAQAQANLATFAAAWAPHEASRGAVSRSQ